MKYCRTHITIFLLLALGVTGYPQKKSVDALKKNAERNRELSQNQISRNDQQLFKTAQNYIRRNRYDTAIPILEDLVKRNPENNSYYDWLLRSYLTVSQIESADSLVNAMLVRFPQFLRYQIDHADVLYRQNREDEALTLWREILQSQPRNVNLYSQIAKAMIGNRLWDEAVQVYKSAITNIPNTEHFYMNIANLYKSRLMYTEAADYYLKYLMIQPKQEKYIFNQILAFQIPEEDQENFFKVMEQRVETADSSSQLTYLMGQLYQRYGKYEQALSTFLKLEEKDSEGRRLISFASAAEKDSAYTIALKAYQQVIRRYPNSKQLFLAYRGSVKTLFQLTDAENQPAYAEQAFQLIDTVKVRFPNHPETYWLSYLAGKFHLTYYFDVDKALSIFSDILKKPGLPANLQSEILLDKGRCEIIQGDLKKSMATFEKITDAKFKGEALISLAESAYFSNNWNQSREFVNTLLQTQGMSSGVTNDAISLQLKLGYAEKNPAVLSKMARAELLIFQQKKSEAREELIELIKMQPIPPTIKSESYLLISQLSLDLDETETSLEYCRMAISDSTLSLYADDHLYLMGFVLETRLNEKDQAFEVYKSLLENYPNSLLVDDTRIRMRKLRDRKEPELP
jgi:tetratricopeptide (TPR) repeat protein